MLPGGCRQCWGVMDSRPDIANKSAQSDETKARRALIDAIVADHSADLRRFVRSRLRDEGEREDVVQDAFLRLARYEDLNALTTPRQFLFKVAENLIRDRHRRAQTRREDAHDALDDHVLADQTADPALVAEQRDDLARVRAAISALDEPMRSAFILSRYQELSYRQIATRMNISVKTVERYISQSLFHLRDALSGGEEVSRASFDRKDGQ